MALLVLGLVLFIGTHSIYILAPGVRAAAVGRIGYNGWRGLYSLVSLAGLVLVGFGIGAARLEPVSVWEPPFWTAHLSMTVMAVAFPILLSAFLPGRISAALKHPMLMAVKVWAVAHLLANGTLSDMLLFGSFFVWALAARLTLLARPMTEPRPAAPVRGRNDMLALIIGLAIYAAFLFDLHGRLIGIPLLG